MVVASINTLLNIFEDEMENNGFFSQVHETERFIEKVFRFVKLTQKRKYHYI